MYAVIFRAEINELNEQYTAMAERLRERAIEQYGCIEFISFTEGDIEIAVSYWPSLDYIKAWKNDSEHQKAQQLGKNKWYKSYRVEIAEIKKGYGDLR